jgi:hypothetical protein
MPRMRRKTPFSLAATMLAPVGLGYVIARLPYGTFSLELLLAILLFATASLIPPVLLRRRTPGINPGAVCSVVTFISLGVGAFAWFSASPAGAAAGLTRTWIVRALLLATGGMLTFWAGYWVTSRRWRGRETIVPTRVVSPSTLVWVFVAGEGMKILLFKWGVFGYLLNPSVAAQSSSFVQWIAVASGLSNLAIIAAAIHAFGNNSRAHVRLLLAIVPISAVVGLFSGFKGDIVFPILLVMLVRFYYRPRVPWRPITLVALLMFLVVPANITYRAKLRPGEGVFLTSTGGVLAALTGTIGESVEMPLSQRLSIVGQWGTARFRNVDSLALIMQKTPHPNPYLRGRLYALGIPIILVPRFLWPSKPVLDNGYIFSQEYLDLPASSVTSTPITEPGDLYMNFGVAGVLSGMFVWGVVCSCLYAWIRRRPGNDSAALLLFFAALLQLANVEADFVSLLATAFRALLLAWIVGRALYPSWALERSLGSEGVHRAISSGSTSRTV